MTRAPAAAPVSRRRRFEVCGAVQGVGFRPWVYREATLRGLSGWVQNDARGLFVEVEGPASAIEAFERDLNAGGPPHARIESIAATWVEVDGGSAFSIRPSGQVGTKTVAVLADLATCPDCLDEVLDPAGRRHRYAFTNCTRCGPRFTIVRELPYDRPRTTMAAFALCPDCRREYEDPADRRFHAQPVACPACGPTLVLRDADGRALAAGGGAIDAAAGALRDGRIVAVKGLGGFQLLCDAADEGVVGRLRERKRREEKPFALMARDLDAVRELAETDAAAEAALAGAAAPILLLRRNASARVARNVAPGMTTLGVMLPATPMHHLLLRAYEAPVVATSGNLSDEPICTEENEALDRLRGIADVFLVHDRPIARHADDSVAWVLRGETRVLRRARGFAPLPVAVPSSLPAVLAVGAHQKNAVALALGPRVFLGQHVGDLDTPQALAAFERCADDFLRLWDVRPEAIACDLHPDYASSRWAREAATPAGRLPSVPVFAVQHHHAHLASCLAENGVDGRALGVVWDGTGLGDDGTIWGGEFLLGDAAGYRRVASLRPFPLPGGDAAAREPRRVAFALLWALGAPAPPTITDFTEAERRLLTRQLERGLHTPTTSSMGRLFDAVAALAGIRQRSAFEGQAAMLLESAATDVASPPYALPVVSGDGRLELDWRPLVAEIVRDVAAGAEARVVASRFHAALVAAIVEVARAVAEPRVALTGGCFQNRTLAERAARALEAEGFEILLHKHVPPNDGGLALGQAVVAARRLQEV